MGLLPTNDRATAAVNLYLATLGHDYQSDVMVDLLTELRAFCDRHCWDFNYALRRSKQEFAKDQAALPPASLN